MELMINIPKKIIEEAYIANDNSELEEYVLTNYPITAIIKDYVKLYMSAKNEDNKPQQISVTEAEYELITNLFKIRGQRVLNGVVVKELRGRPRKAVRDDNENVLPMEE